MKSRAQAADMPGKRIVSVPELLLPELRTHLNTYAGEGDDGLVFIGPKGAQLRRANFTRTWSKAITAAVVSIQRR
ncbi:hypothetical protein [Sphaerisporangium perillae]|uniref:hypothetical protein n=1 Tax=Sphaerisporangium perillae TaxID=2935860 RepID=UPI00200DA43E|nr:hypothetical protein [Sphaerisporangium perillae]